MVIWTTKTGVGVSGALSHKTATFPLQLHIVIIIIIIVDLFPFTNLCHCLCVQEWWQKACPLEFVLKRWPSGGGGVETEISNPVFNRP